MKKNHLKIICLLVAVFIAIILSSVLTFNNTLNQSNTSKSDDMELVKGDFIDDAPEIPSTVPIKIDSVDISEVPLDQIFEEDYDFYYKEGSVKKKLVKDSHPITGFQFSSSKNRYGYMENFDIYDETIPWDREVVLHIGETATRETKEIYHGNHRTAGWEWFSENEVLIPYGCGTECEVLYLVDVNSGSKETIQQGVGYEWSSDKNWLFAYRYSGKLGIVVFNRNQDKIYEYLKDPDHRDKYDKKIKGLWASSTNRLAVVKEKDNEDQLELVIVDFDQGTKILVQKDLSEEGCTDMWWESNLEFICYNSIKGEQHFHLIASEVH